jgi:hypothetical protein
MAMAESLWHAAENGASLGQTGSEQGTIVRDEEHDFGARISLERDTHTAPFAITCGIYGWMMHTRFFGSQPEAEAQYEEMKAALSALLAEADRTAQFDGGRKALMDGVGEFVERFP